jgi:hypothetical protein
VCYTFIFILILIQKRSSDDPDHKFHNINSVFLIYNLKIFYINSKLKKNNKNKIKKRVAIIYLFIYLPLLYLLNILNSSYF